MLCFGGIIDVAVTRFLNQWLTRKITSERSKCLVESVVKNDLIMFQD
jgi:hypothetical protein